MASKEEKKSKTAKSPETEGTKKKDSVEIVPETKSKSKKDRSSKISTPPGEVIVDHSGLIDKKHTDSTLAVGTSFISVHKAIISARNEHILAGVAPKKNKKGGAEYDMKDIELPILRLVVQWLYSDKIDVNAVPLPDLVKVIKAATHYQMDRLSQICEQHLQSTLTLENIWDLLSLSHTQKVERARTLCMEFAFTHHDALLADPRFRKLEVDLIVDEGQLYGKHKKELESGWLPPKVEVTAISTMVDDFKALYDSMSGADHVIVVEKQNIKCHKAILGHASPKLMELADGKDPVSMPKEFKAVSADTFSALLRYLYYGNTDIAPMAATQLISFAKQLGLQTLVDICEAKIRHGIDTSTCLSILEVAYHPLLKDREDLQKELKVNCRSFFIDHIRDIAMEPLRSMDSAIGADLLIAVQKQIGVSWSIGGDSSAMPSNATVVKKDRSSHRLSSSHSTEALKKDSSSASAPAVEEEDANKAEAKGDGVKGDSAAPAPVAAEQQSSSTTAGKESSTSASSAPKSAPIAAASSSDVASDSEDKSHSGTADKHAADGKHGHEKVSSSSDKVAPIKPAAAAAAAAVAEDEEPPLSPSKISRQESKRDRKDKEKKDKKDKKEEKEEAAEEAAKDSKDSKEKDKKDKEKEKEKDKKNKDKKKSKDE